MSEPNYRDWILETIDSLRGRKARPDLERICRMVRRRHGTDPERTRAELETLIQERTVLKVSYKGSISYRNAAKVHRKCRKGAEEIAEASGSKHTGLPRRDDDNGESVSELEEGTGDRKSDPTASVCEEEEVAQENSLFCGKTSALREMSPGAEEQRRFPVQTPGDCDEEQEQQEEEDEETSHKDAPPPKRLKSSPEESASGLGDRLVEAVRSLSGGHRRHAPPPGLKEILELLSTQSATPDEKLTRHRVNRELEREIARGRLRRTRLGHITVPGRARPERAPRDGRSAETDKVKTEETLDGASAEDVSRSSSAENRDQTVSDEDLTHTHPEPDDVINPAPTSERKPQSLASSSFLPQEVEAGAVSVSQRNTESVDLKPTRPQLQDPPEMMAETVKLPSSVPPPDCSECKLEVAASSCLLTPSASPGGGEDPNMDGLMKPEMSPADWTVADVVRYFTAAGFPEQALAFRTQEIDGKSLLLMRRNDVLMGLSIKLGPALKIYERHVKVLQRSLFHEDSMFC